MRVADKINAARYCECTLKSRKTIENVFAAVEWVLASDEAREHPAAPGAIAASCATLQAKLHKQELVFSKINPVTKQMESKVPPPIFSGLPFDVLFFCTFMHA